MRISLYELHIRHNTVSEQANDADSAFIFQKRLLLSMADESEGPASSSDDEVSVLLSLVKLEAVYLPPLCIAVRGVRVWAEQCAHAAVRTLRRVPALLRQDHPDRSRPEDALAHVSHVSYYKSH